MLYRSVWRTLSVRRDLSASSWKVPAPLRRMTLSRSVEPLVWIDCEMTGLDPKAESILSFCCFVTDSNLKLLDEAGLEAVIHHSEERLGQMDAWCTKTHGESGLTKAAIESTTTAEEAAEDLLTYIMSLIPTKGTALLAGNSIHADRSFLALPPYDRVLSHLHYRLLDVSSIKEACRRWAPDEVLASCPPKKGLHTAREDILESIEEAKYFRSLFDKMESGGVTASTVNTSAATR